MILVLEHGQVIERGKHEELLAQKGRYYQLYTGMMAVSYTHLSRRHMQTYIRLNSP